MENQHLDIFNLCLVKSKFHRIDNFSPRYLNSIFAPNLTS